MKNRLLATLVASVTMLAMAFVAMPDSRKRTSWYFTMPRNLKLEGKPLKRH